MKKILSILLLLALLVSSTAYAQPVAIYQNPTAPVTLYTEAGARGPLAVDGRGYIIIGAVGTGATDLGKAEDAVAGSGWTGVGSLSVANTNLGAALCGNNDFCPVASNINGAVYTNLMVSNESNSAVRSEDSAATSGDALVAVAGAVNTFAVDKAADGDYIGLSTNAKGDLFTNIDINHQISQSTGILKLEDQPAADGHALVGVAGTQNLNATANGQQGDYVPFSVGTYGNVLTSPHYDSTLSVNFAAIQREDVAAIDAGAGHVGLVQTQDPLSVDQGASNDFAYAKVDRAGRTITTLAPAGETWTSCSNAATGTGDTAIKAAVASNRIYVTSISCVNTSAVASSLAVKDGSTALDIGGVGTQAATGGEWTKAYPVPLRGTSNTALNFAMTTTATSTICCAQGYISVN